VSAAAIVSLALGIGANTALFGLVDAVFLRMLPVQTPHELYYFAHHAGPEASSNYPLFERYRALDAFSGVTAYRVGTFRVVTPETVEPVTGQFVSGNYHAVVGVPLALGRGFSIEPDRDPSRSLIAVISDAYWSRRFGRSPSAIGSALHINGRAFEIVGVIGPGFYGLDSDSRVDITVPLSVMALEQPDFFDDHGTWMSLRLVGRLKAGTTEAQALAAADAAFRQYMSEPEQQWVRGMPGSDRFRSAALLPAGKGSDGRRDRTATPIRLLMAMAGVVLTMTIVGVVEDVRHERLTVEEPPRMVYTALAQMPALVTFEGNSAVPERVTIAMRTNADPVALAGVVREYVRGIDRSAMVSYVRTFGEQLDAAVSRERLLATLSTAFGVFALLLACVGLYGTLSYRVVQRSREIGVRMALGAARMAVLRQVLREGLTVAAAGVVIGGIAAFWATRAMATFLFEVSPRDPLTLAAVVAILLATALVAGFFPARRAATVDPARILRAE